MKREFKISLKNKEDKRNSRFLNAYFSKN